MNQHSPRENLMRTLRVFLASVILIWGGTGSVLADAAISITEKAALQATMQTHINRQLVKGAYLHLKKICWQDQKALSDFSASDHFASRQIFRSLFGFS